MLIYEHSRNYKIIIIIETTEKFIDIVTIWKSSKKIEKLIKKKGAHQVSKVRQV